MEQCLYWDSSQSFRRCLTGVSPGTVEASPDFSGSQGLVTKTHIGVLLSDLLNDAEVILDPTHKNDSLRQYLEFTATDCYQVIVALAEILSNFGGEQALIAYADGDGNPLTTEEMARLSMPGDKAGGRNIQNITRIVIRSAP
jgi:hypothetical protein